MRDLLQASHQSLTPEIHEAIVEANSVDVEVCQWWAESAQTTSNRQLLAIALEETVHVYLFPLL